MNSLVKAITGLSIAAAVVSCKSKTEEKAAVVIPNVAVATAVTEIVADQQVYSSSVQPWAKNNIVPQSSGRIEQLLVEVGDYVQAGDTIARMDDIQLKQSELQVLNDKIEYERLKSLKEKGGISVSDFEAFELSYNVHKSTYQNLLKNTILRSPISGVISSRNYDRGDMYSMTQPIYVVEQIVPVKLIIGVSEADYQRVKKGDKATLEVDAFPGREFSGTITNIYPTIDATTHTFSVEVKVANADRRLRPGMYAKVTVTFGKDPRVIVPDKAVTKQQGSGDRYVYLYDASTRTVSFRTVKLGKRLGDRYVILEGVNEGDKVVTDGILRVKDGIEVNLK